MQPMGSQSKGSGADPRYDKGRLKGGGRSLHLVRSVVIIALIAVAIFALFSTAAFLGGERNAVTTTSFVVVVVAIVALALKFVSRRSNRGSLDSLDK